MRIESTRNCCPSSLRRSAAVTRAILRPSARSGNVGPVARSRLHELSAHGVSVWVDSLSREMLETGHLARLIDEDAVVGVTSNPTIFEKALSAGEWYDEQLRAELERSRRHEGGLLRARRRGHQARLRPPPAGVGANRRCRRLRLARGRSRSRIRAGRDVRAGEAAPRARRPAEPLREDPRHRPRASAPSRTRSRRVARSTSLSSSRSNGMQRSPRRTCAASSGWSPTEAIRRTSLSVASFFVSRVDTEADRRLEEIGREGPAGPAGDRQREARLPALPRGLLGRALGCSRRRGCTAAALSVGVDVDEEPRLSRRPLRRGAHRARHGEHDAVRDDRRRSRITVSSATR